MAETSSILAINQDISFARGESWSRSYTVTALDGTTPVDITGATIVFRLKRTPNGPVLVSKSSASGSSEIEITDASNGVYEVKLAPADTRAIRHGEYVYDIWVQDIPSSGDEYVHVSLNGSGDRNCTITESVYRASDAIPSGTLVGPSLLDSDFDDVGIMYRAGSENYDILKANLSASGAPGVGDDSGDGYGVGSLWIDTVNDEVYWCADASVGAAVWKQVASGGGGGGVSDHGALTGLTDDDHTQYILASGTRAFSGDIDLGANAITNVGNVDGRDVSADGTALDAAVSKLAGIESNATADQTGAEIKALYEAEADTNALTDTLLSKLNNIEALADVTDAANVAAAGAVMDSDFSANGRMVRSGSGSYTTVLDNLAASTDPGVSDDTTSGYAPGSIWVNTTTPAAFICISAAEGAADWNQIDGAGGGLSNVVEDTTPQLGGMLDVNGNAIGDGTLELLTFSETASAVNNIQIANAATGGAPAVSSVGDDTAVPLNLACQGNSTVNVITNGTSRFTFKASQNESKRNLTPDSDGGYDLGSGSIRWGSLFLTTAIDIEEASAPSTPGTNSARIYVDSSTGNVMVKFDSGNTATIATYA